MTTRTTITAATTLSLALLATACSQADVGDNSLSPDEEVALSAAISAVSAQREALPITDADLDSLARTNVVAARVDARCEVQGIVSGVWYDEGLRPVFEGSWFKLGTGSEGGTINGTYSDGFFEGTAIGDDIEADVTGSYNDGVFLGDWVSVDASGEAISEGELIGRYERRNDTGGYFFGLWGQCDSASDASSL
ncbi:MAG: hypothetical protein GXP62_14310 [Oligoflexia bacterium]|nr:hypothetical protein [Oligoflexia bacterium]